jgi:RNA-dependent RNA polymerase
MQFDKRLLAWGVQWEIARLYSCQRLKWEEINIPSLDLLTGPNVVAAPKVSPSVLSGLHSPAELSHSSTQRSPWEELDREQASIQAQDTSGLGTLDGNSGGWFGGKVQQQMSLFLRHNFPADRPFEERVAIRLLPQEKGPSRRFARYFGSRRILQLKIPKEIVNEHQRDLISYLTKGFVLLGRVFRAFHAKERKVYFLETNEIYDGRKSLAPEGDTERISFDEFILLYNQIDPQSSQVCRFGLACPI